MGRSARARKKGSISTAGAGAAAGAQAVLPTPADPLVIEPQWPRVSLCTVTGQQTAGLLPLLMQQILAQTYPRQQLEWVVVDDGRDGRLPFQPSEQQLQGLKLRYERLSAAATVGQQRNLSHLLSTGEIVVVMDVDAYYPPGRVEHAVEQLLGSEALVAGCSQQPVLLLAQRQLWLTGASGPNQAPAATLAYKRELLQHSGWDPTANTNDDVSLLQGGSFVLEPLDANFTALGLIAPGEQEKQQRLLASPAAQPAQPLPDAVAQELFEQLGGVLEAYQAESLKAQAAALPQSPAAADTSPSISLEQVPVGRMVARMNRSSIASQPSIPKLIHVIWIGDDSKCPTDCIKTWTEMNPDYEFRQWGNHDLENESWILADAMRQLLPRELNGVADVMRWEILYKYGGLAFDADSMCIRSLPDWLLEPEIFAAWENEQVRPGLIACGALGATKQHPFIARIIQDIANDANITEDMAWKKVGPLRLTNSWRQSRFSGLTIYPSHYFYPYHFAGSTYEGKGPVFARQAWGSTKKNYGNLIFE